MTSSPQPIRQTPQEEIKAGYRIQHDKFGTGLVVSVNQKGENTEITVAFDQVGIKKLLWEYASAFIKITG